MRSFWFIVLIGSLATACVPHKKVLYFKDLAEQQGSINLPEAPEVILITGDVVEVNIASVSQETNIYFQKQGSATDRNFAPNTYQIAADGTIDLPLIGKVLLAGKNIAEAESSLKELLTEYLQKPSVNIRIMSFKITVMGEVGAPGVYGIPDGRVNLLEAIAMAGDLTIFGRRDNLLLIRNESGQKEYKRLSLNDSKVLQSEHFYMRNNDVLYIEPSKGRSAADDNLYRILPLTVSVLTFVVLIITISQ